MVIKRSTTLTRLPPFPNHPLSVRSTLQASESDDLSQNVGFFSLNHLSVSDNHGLGPCRLVCPDLCHDQMLACNQCLAAHSPACQPPHRLAYHYRHLVVCRPL